MLQSYKAGSLDTSVGPLNIVGWRLGRIRWGGGLQQTMRTHRRLFCGHGIGVARECVVRMKQLTLTSQPCHKPPCSMDPKVDQNRCVQTVGKGFDS